MRAFVHLLSLLALGAFGAGVGRWLRDPGLDSGLAVLVVLAVVLALALRQLYRRPAEPDAQTAPAEEGVPAPLWAEERLDLNAATAEDLRALPGVGPVTAQRIVDHREANGPFDSVEALTAVAGFGPARVRALADRLRV